MDSGLEGLIAAETVLSHSDGAKGILWVRGYTLAELVAGFGYEGAVALLWEGFAGDGLDREAIRAQLGAARVAAFAGLPDWLDRSAGRSGRTIRHRAPDSWPRPRSPPRAGAQR